ncbi:MAG: glycosyltransferase family 9 protein [Syntrophaceae bacterium]|nr:glycosyltransferase family 9 protein [Syntrophaceae bacterium]
MKAETIRIIDVWTGKGICFFLTMLRRLWDAFAPRPLSPPPVRKILFIKLIEQGATVLAYSALRRAIDQAGRENVYFMVFEENREILFILDLLPAENVLIIRNRDFLTFSRDILSALIRVRKLRIDAVVDLEFFARASAIISFLTGAERRVGLHRFTSEAPYRGDLMTHRVQYNPYFHTAKAYLLLVEALARSPGEIPLSKIPERDLAVTAPRFRPTEEETGRLEKRLADIWGEAGSGPLVLLNPNAGDLLPLRKWSTENFIALGRKILEKRPDVRLIITGAPSEAASAEAVCSRIGSRRAVTLAGRTTLRELLVLYTLADVLVTNDSGPGHFASMTDIDNVVLFGPETPHLFGAIGGRPRTIYAKLACSPCVNAFNHRFSPCNDNRCMQVITVEEILRTVLACLAERNKASGTAS